MGVTIGLDSLQDKRSSSYVFLIVKVVYGGKIKDQLLNYRTQLLLRNYRLFPQELSKSYV
jgi:hypothetical protein